MHPESLEDQIAGTKRMIVVLERRVAAQESYLRQARRDLERLEERRRRECPNLGDLVEADARKPVN